MVTVATNLNTSWLNPVATRPRKIPEFAVVVVLVIVVVAVVAVFLRARFRVHLTRRARASALSRINATVLENPEERKALSRTHTTRLINMTGRNAMEQR